MPHLVPSPFPFPLAAIPIAVTATAIGASPKEISVTEILMRPFRMSIGAIATGIAGCPKRISVPPCGISALPIAIGRPAMAMGATAMEIGASPIEIASVPTSILARQWELERRRWPLATEGVPLLRLGFQIVADPPGWIFVSRDSCMIMLGECPDDIHPSELGCHNYFAYLRVDDVDACHAELHAKGIEPLSAPADEPWGMRELAIRTSDGHRIKFGQMIEP